MALSRVLQNATVPNGVCVCAIEHVCAHVFVVASEHTMLVFVWLVRSSLAPQRKTPHHTTFSMSKNDAASLVIEQA